MVHQLLMGYLMTKFDPSASVSKLSLLFIYGGARGVMVIVVGNEHGDTSSNRGRD